MTIKKFLAFSVIFHILLFTGLYFLPEPQVKKAKEFVANLVSPEEMKKPAAPPPPPPPPPRLRILPAPRSVLPVPPLPPSGRRVPAPLPERSLPSAQKPVIPGEGMPARKQLKEEARPVPGTGTEGTGKGRTEREGEEAGTADRTTSRPSDKPGYLSRKKMFDAGVIDQIARKDTEGKKGDTENPVTFDTKEYKVAGYMTKLRQKIESIWVYPPEAAERGIYGDLKIRFTIKKDGRLGAVELVRTSGYKMLDDAAIKALKDGEPYWPLPDSWGRNSYTIEGHFVYLYGGYYLR
ncbi:MAG: energy transducer TonB [Nitrospiraceae bacterium]|nr:energy transducer TonB [Nitrospiraceae bacterium]